MTEYHTKISTLPKAYPHNSIAYHTTGDIAFSKMLNNAENDYLRTLDAIAERLEKESAAQVGEKGHKVEDGGKNHDAGSQSRIHGGSLVSGA